MVWNFPFNEGVAGCGGFDGEISVKIACDANAGAFEYDVDKGEGFAGTAIGNAAHNFGELCLHRQLSKQGKHHKNQGF